MIGPVGMNVLTTSRGPSSSESLEETGSSVLPISHAPGTTGPATCGWAASGSPSLPTLADEPTGRSLRPLRARGLMPFKPLEGRTNTCGFKGRPPGLRAWYVGRRFPGDGCLGRRRDLEGEAASAVEGRAGTLAALSDIL